MPIGYQRAAHAPVRLQHIVNISGGKDSQACALLAAERGRPFRLVMADTGNENQVTLDHAHYVAEFVGQPLEIVRADFSREIESKRRFVAEEWPKKGVSVERVERALSALVPTGNPFLDLCIWKGRFPSRKAQFCTEFLKSRAIEGAVIASALAQGPVVQWLGVRRDESLNRRHAPMFQRVRRSDAAHDMLLYRPLIHWTAENVFGYCAARGAAPNPLYLMGMARVGCFPCIHSNKAELRQIAIRFPEAVARIMEWEAHAAEASKRGAGTFFAADSTPEGAALARSIRARAAAQVDRVRPDLSTPGREKERARAITAIANDLSASAPWPNAGQVFEWARTSRGGRQFDMFLSPAFDEGLSCSSQYGLCE